MRRTKDPNREAERFLGSEVLISVRETGAWVGGAVRGRQSERTGT